MPFLARITNTFFVSLINRLGVRPPPPEGFELQNVVVPVSIVDADIAIAATTTTPLLGTPGSAGLVTPAANDIIADSGALAFGNWDFRVHVGTDEPALANSLVRIQKRDAANAATIWEMLVPMQPNGEVTIAFRAPMALNERVRVLKFGAPTAATNWIANVWATVST